MHSNGLPWAIEAEREIQTHANLVLLRGDRAFKLKKPVKFPFLDYSTLPLRRRMILNELQLNRRFAFDLYLGVCEVIARDGALHFGAEREDLSDRPGSDVVDYAVIMRRIPDAAWLPRRIREDQVSEADIAALARSIVASLNSAPTGDDVRAAGMPENLRANTVANVAECRAFVPGCLPEDRWNRLDGLLRVWFEDHHEVFEQRVESGRIRDGHGDLKPSNIAIVDDRPVVTDCIEFNPLFRRLDTLCEFGFLATGLESLGRFDIARTVLAGYRDSAGDDYPPELRRYYQAHLACVMGKVTALQLAEPEVPHSQKEAARRLARHCFALADFHAREPHVIAVGGVMGCGKSTVAQALGAYFGWPVVSSDVVRKRLAGVAPTQRLPDSAYTREAGGRVYEALYDAARKAPDGVILDAQFPSRESRAGLKEAAAFVHCDAPDEVVSERMKAREFDPARVSDATADLLDEARARFETPGDDEGFSVIPFDTRRPAGEIVEEVRQALLGEDFDPAVAWG